VVQAIVPGFDDLVRDQQRSFRAVMDALARPARPVAFQSPTSGPAALSPNAFAIALTLLDFEVSYYLSESLAEAEEAITFHTGSCRVTNPDQAEFAFVDLRSDSLNLAAFAQGEPEYPDRSTTVIAFVSSAVNGPRLLCRGPGIATEQHLELADLPADFPAQWGLNRKRAPLGVDLIFVTSDTIVGLPRSTRIIEEER
jgi:alpha-D-ribose 1-methylphosphonate 5-triphosphate synthase subunit PhnH